MQTTQPMLWEQSRLKTLYMRRRVFRCISIAFSVLLFPIPLLVKAFKRFAKLDEMEIAEIERDLLIDEYEQSKYDVQDD